MQTTAVPAQPTLTAAARRLQPARAHGNPKLHRRARGRRNGRWLAVAALLVACAAFLTPLLWMLCTSLKTAEETMAYPPRWLPESLQWRNFLDAIRNERVNFPLWTRNTLLVESLVVPGTVLSSALVAYGFARIRFPGRGILFGIMLASMMIPFPVVMVSLFSMYRWLGEHTGIEWIGTLKPLWVPAWFGSAFSIFLLRQFFLTIPEELSDAARIDGCGELGIFFRIILPLSRPALAVVALLSFMYTWNDFLAPLIFLQRAEQFTLALGLQNFQSQQGGTPWHQLMAATILVILPVLVLFFLAQRTFIAGIATTGMKG